jgi:hypothetical protein
MPINVDRYDSIAKNLYLFKPKQIDTIIPMPNDSDYKSGYINRYFVQKSNDISSPIFEISQNEYPTFLRNPFYTAVTILWRLIGTNDEISESNFKSIRFVHNDMPNLYKYIGNTLQFSKQ